MSRSIRVRTTTSHCRSSPRLISSSAIWATAISHLRQPGALRPLGQRIAQVGDTHSAPVEMCWAVGTVATRALALLHLLARMAAAVAQWKVEGQAIAGAVVVIVWASSKSLPPLSRLSCCCDEEFSGSYTRLLQLHRVVHVVPGFEPLQINFVESMSVPLVSYTLLAQLSTQP